MFQTWTQDMVGAGVIHNLIEKSIVLIKVAIKMYWLYNTVPSVSSQMYFFCLFLSTKQLTHSYVTETVFNVYFFYYDLYVDNCVKSLRTELQNNYISVCQNQNVK